MELILEENGGSRRGTVDSKYKRSDDVVRRENDDVDGKGELGEVKTSSIGGILGDKT